MMLCVGSWALLVVVPSAAGVAAGDVFLAAPVLAFLPVVALVVFEPAMGRAAGRAAWWFVVPAYGAAELALDPMLDWGAHDRHGPPMTFVRWMVVIVLAGAVGTFSLARLSLSPALGPPKVWSAPRVGAIVLLLVAVTAVLIGAFTPVAHYESDDLILADGGEPTDVGRGWRAWWGDDGIEVEPPSGAPAQHWRRCGIEGPHITRSWSAQRMVLHEPEGTFACAFDRAGFRVPLAAHEIGRGPRFTLGASLTGCLLLATLVSLGAAFALRRRVDVVARGEDARRGPDGTLVLDSGRIVSLEGRMDVVVLALSEPDPTYRSAAIARVSRCLPGNKAIQTTRLAARIDALEALALASALALLPYAWVLSRF